MNKHERYRLTLSAQPSTDGVVLWRAIHGFNWRQRVCMLRGLRYSTGIYRTMGA